MKNDNNNGVTAKLSAIKIQRDSLVKTQDLESSSVTKCFVWDFDEVEKKMKAAYDEDSERALLSILKDNSFLFYDLFSRKYVENKQLTYPYDIQFEQNLMSNHIDYMV